MSEIGAEIVTLVEIDVPFCDLIYSESPCTAALGETGNRKCYNTAATCQDRPNFTPSTRTYRFALSQSGVEQYGPLVPNLRGVRITPLEINIGGMDDSVSPFGRRETCTLTFDDHQHSDLRRDKYRLERHTGEAQAEIPVGAVPDTITDEAGNNDGTNNGATVALVDGRWALEFDGVDDYVALDHSLASPVAQIGFEIWFHTTEQDGNIIASYDRNEYFRMEVGGDAATRGYVGVAFMTDAGQENVFGSSSFVADGLWHHVAFFYDNGTARLLVDGVEENVRTSGTTLGSGITRFGFFGVGSEADVLDGEQGPTDQFQGWLAEARTWMGITRTQAEIQADMNRRLTGNEEGLVGYWPMQFGVGFDPYERGTHWGKFLARHPFHEGYAVRVYQGEMGQDVSEMRVRRYLIDKINGPDDGQVTIECKDLFSLVESRKAKAPRASRGELANDISDTATSANLSPIGIGDEEYPASGWVAINDEAIAFTRSGDALTFTERAALGTEAEEHENEDKVQVVLAYQAKEVPDIIEDLLTTYANVPPANIPKAEWDAEANENIQALYTAYIAEPTAVEDLVGELAIQAGFSIWPEVDTNLIRIRALLPPVLVDPGPIVTDNEWLREGSFDIKRQPAKRVSQVWVYYGQRNPLEDVDDPTNYASRVIRGDLDAELDEEYGTPSVREVFGRWIPQFGRGVAENAGNRILSIFRDPPFKGSFNADISRDGQLRLAEPFRLRTDDVQDDTGARTQTNNVPIQVFRDNAKVRVKFQELDFYKLPDEDFNLFIDNDTLNFNIRNEFNALFRPPEDGDVVNVFISSGIFVGSQSTNEPAMVVGDWPEGVTINIILVDATSRLLGMGGMGGRGDASAFANQLEDFHGHDGGPALHTRYPVTITNGGLLASGGGGGGGFGFISEFYLRPPVSGGGGGGCNPGAGGEIDAAGADIDEFPGEDGTKTGGGSGGHDPSIDIFGGDGGDPGMPGTAATGPDDTGGAGQHYGDGGSAGVAIDGASFVTFETEGTILGSQIN